MKKTKLLLQFFSVLLMLGSCKQSEISNDPTVLDDGYAKLSIEAYQDSFARVLSIAMQDQDVREFLKAEVLKKVNKDFEVFYPFVRDEIVSNGETFRDKLVKHAGKSELLDMIEISLPLLTMLVPNLPSGFSAEGWQPDTEVPLVTSSFSKGGEFVYHRPDNDEPFRSDDKLIPGFPVVVIKANERIKLINNQPATLQTDSRSAAHTLNNRRYGFTYNEFDGTKSNLSKKASINLRKTADRGVSPNPTQPGGRNNPQGLTMGYPKSYADFAVLKSAFEEMGTDETTWQRDHVYFGLTKTNTTGAFRSLDIRNLLNRFK